MRVRLLAASEVTGQIDFAPAEGELPEAPRGGDGAPAEAPGKNAPGKTGNRAHRRRRPATRKRR